MKNRMKFLINKEIIILSLFLLTAQSGVSQSFSNSNSSDVVANVNYTVSNGKVLVTYDLQGDYDELYKISLILRRASSKEVMYVPKTVSGDIGEGHFAGKNKQIIWEIKKDFPEGLSGEDFYFIVQAEKINEGTNFLLWTGIGVAAAAAVATYIIVGGENGSSPTNNSESSFPFPPGRP